MAATSYTNVVLITGANQGIGFETAKKLASEHSDYHVIMTGRRREAIEEAVAKLQASGLSNVEALVLDVTSDESIAAAVKEVGAKHGRLDVLINNAGISTGWGEKATRQRWLEIYNTNVIGVEFVTEAFIPLLQKSRGVQRIVNVTSVMGSMEHKLDKNHLIHTLEWCPYSVTKSALNQLTLHYVARYPTWKINLTCPGYVATNLNAFQGSGPVSDGAINTCRLATLGKDGETGTWTNKDGPIKW